MAGHVKREKIIIGAVIGLTALVSLAAAVSASIPSKEVYDFEPEAEEQEKHLVFKDSGTEIVTFSASYLRGYDNRTGELPLKLVATPSEEYRINSLRLRIRPDNSPHGKVYLATPGGYPYPQIRFYETPDSRTSVINIKDTEFQGQGTITLDTLIEQHRTSNTTVNVQVKPSEKGVIGKSYVAEGQLEIDPETANPR